jgi:hypothetical protein
MDTILQTLGETAAVFDTVKQCLVHEGRSVSGLCRVLTALFYPDHVHKGTRPTKGAPRQLTVTKRRGIQVHLQIGEWQRTGRLPRDSLSRNVVDALTTRGITLVQCEVPIVYKAANVGTLIDALGTDGEGRTVVIEFKAGYQRVVRSHDTLCLLPQHKVPSIPRNHAFLQLAMTRAILREQYAIGANQYLLVITNGAGVQIHSLPEWANDVTASLLLNRFK